MVGFNSGLIVNFADGAILAGCSPADPMKGHYVPLAAFGANALNLHFVVVFNFIQISVVCFVPGR